MLTFTQARKYLGVSTSTLYRMMQRKEVTGYYIAHRWKFQQRDLDELIQAHASYATA